METKCPFCEQPYAMGGACSNPNCGMVTDRPGIHAIPPAARASTTPESMTKWADDGKCTRCGDVLQERFNFCPACGRARQQIIDPYSLVSGRGPGQPGVPHIRPGRLSDALPQIRSSYHPQVLRRTPRGDK